MSTYYITYISTLSACPCLRIRAAKMFRSICCCLPGLSCLKTPDADTQPRPEMTESTTPRSERPYSSTTTFDSQDQDGCNGYASVVSLPRYTPRPLSIREKTVDAHLPSSPPPTSRSSRSDSIDEKQRFEYDAEGGVADDGSSAFSFQSSYGNTSTATRETPPPPYSPRSRSMSLSFSSQRGMPLQPLQPRSQPIAQPRPVYQRQRPEWVGRSPRCSEEH